MYHVFTETLEEEAAKYPSVLPLYDVHKIEVRCTRYKCWDLNIDIHHS